MNMVNNPTAPGRMLQTPIQRKSKRYLKFLLYILPAFGIWFIFQIVPNLRIFWLALLDWDGMSADSTFVGLQNFKELTLDPTFPSVVLNTLIYIGVVVAVQISLGVLFAVLLKKNTTFNKFFRTVFFSPLVFGTVMVAMVWSYIYDPNLGFLNNFLELIGLESLQQSWLSTPVLAICCIASVSYTHLDVYKRQVGIRACGSGADHAGEHAEDTGEHAQCERGADIPAGGMERVRHTGPGGCGLPRLQDLWPPVDVYKRQLVCFRADRRPGQHGERNVRYDGLYDLQHDEHGGARSHRRTRHGI